jgi:hypothetical protein
MASPPFFLPKNSSAYAPELVWLEQTWRIAACSPRIWKGRATCMRGAGILNWPPKSEEALSIAI